MEVVKFNHPEVVLDHYRYRGGVENQNSLRRDCGNKSQIGLEIAWGTTWWPIIAFYFFHSMY